ncbi:hypothetical protein [Chitinimonas sp. BJB300]|uniref:hypothetical protein n=1 Tax=Chitinimonas sp. BJB300 TaxID=1559339 RepID=UPI000C0EB786|nr:hypothetical protein [Chitinimonas sp. BJB300]PHV09635.1 hypothetical protein CSQ89_20635 [Chitinimonas sp. BJB300]TSJ90153.1 hypothetical protein FG002_008255 [Chitinimonas sp. BJB300]
MAVMPPLTEQMDKTAPPPPDTLDILHILLQESETIRHQVTAICEESTKLLREECYLALESATVGTRWLLVSAIAAATCWLSINVALIAGAMELGLPWFYATLVVSLANAVLAWQTHILARRCLKDMTFSRVRGLMRGQL